MSQSHAAGWPSAAPTAAQLKEFFAQIESGRITKRRLQVFLRERTSPLSQEVERCLSMTVAGFFTAARLTEAGMERRGSITCLIQWINTATTYDYTVSFGKDVPPRINVGSVRELLAKYNRPELFLRVPGIGRRGLEAMLCALSQAHIPYPEES
jgi:hypothetical protein